MEMVSGNEGRLPATLERLFDEPVERTTLSNGLTVVLKEDRSNRLSSVQLWVKTGSIHEGAFLGSGLSHFLEHMLFKGTKKHPGSEISRQVQAAGGAINAYTTFDRTVYYIDGLSEQTPLAVELLADAAFNSLLPEKEVEKEREVILREIDMGLDDPDRQMSRALFEAAYREHPYRLPVIGHRELFEKVSREELLCYYRSRYVPGNMTLVVVGHIEGSSLIKEIEKHFASAPRASGSQPYIPPEPAQLAMREDHRYGNVQICRGGLAFKIPGLEHADAPGLDLLASVLGVGHSSILWQRLRNEKNLVHHVDAVCWNPGNGGLFWISYVCDQDKRAQAQEAILEEIQLIVRDGVDEKRLRKAFRLALAGEVNMRKTMSGQASRLGLAEVVVGDLGYLRRDFSQLLGVNAEKVRDLAGKYLTPEGMTAVSLNSPSSIPAIQSVEETASALPDFEMKVLPNGVRIIFQQDTRLPRINLRMAALGGPFYESNKLRGITGLLATLLVRDTEKRSASQVAESIESVGGSFNEFAGNNSFGFCLEAMSEDTAILLDLFAQALHEPHFNEKTFLRERDAQIAAIKEDLDDIVSFGKNRLRKRFFGEHPFSIDAYGAEETLKVIEISHVKDLRDRLIVGSNVVVSVAGDFQPDQFLPPLIEILEKLLSRRFAASREIFSGPDSPGSFEENLPRQQAVVFQAYPDCGVAGEDYFAGELLTEIFNDMSGRLFARVREERSMAYFVGAQRLAGIDMGMFYLCAGTRPDCCPDMFSEFEAEVSRAASGGVTEDELSRCQTRLKAAKRMGLQTIGARALHGTLNTLYGLPINDWKNYDDRIDGLNIEDLKVFANKWLKVDKRVCLTVKP